MSAWIFRVALLCFFVAALMGLLLRWAFVGELPWLHYRYWVHAHSHVAMLGWLYLGLYALLLRVLVPAELRRKPAYRINALFTMLAVAGMAIAFPLQGYGPWAIACSTAHGLLSYHWVWRLWKDLRATGLERTFVRGSLFFLILSTLTLWTMPFILVQGLQGKAIYYMAVQWYLHFQFNGWFLFACLALFFRWVRESGAVWPERNGQWFFGLLAVSCLLTYALAIAWSNPSPGVFLLNSAGVLIQLVALVFLIIGIHHVRPALEAIADRWTRILLGVSAASFAIKIAIQTVVVVPYIATISFTIRNYVLGFIHLILLGAVSFFLFAQARHLGILRLSRRATRWGMISLLAGFMGTEIWLFLQGTLFWGAKGFLPAYYEVLFSLSVLLPLGVALLLVDQFRTDAPRPAPPGK
jgi:hypothetical protein